jgi:hypothetical protein
MERIGQDCLELGTVERLQEGRDVAAQRGEVYLDL